MQEILKWLAGNDYILLFVVALGAVLLGKVTIKGYGLGMVASAVVVGVTLSAIAESLGVRMSIDDGVKSIFYYLFMYGLGLRVGPSLAHCLRGDGLKFTGLAIASSVAGLLLVVLFVKMWDLPPGTAGGILAGSMTMSAAIGSAAEAVKQGALPLAPGQAFEDVSGMIALSYCLTYIWGTLGILLVCKLLPRWWGIDLRTEAKAYEEHFGVPNVDDAGLAGYRPLSVRAYRLTSGTLVGWTVKQFVEKYPQYKVLNVLRPEPARRASAAIEPPAFSMREEPLALAAAVVQRTTRLHDLDQMPASKAKSAGGVLLATTYSKRGAGDDVTFRHGDIITLGGRLDQMAANTGLIGPEVSDQAALNVPLEAAEILVTNKALEGRELGEFRNAEFAGQVALHHIERGGVPLPLGLNVKLQRFDVLFVAGMKSGVDRLAALAGSIARPSASTDLMTLSLGMILGLLIGQVDLSLRGTNAELGSGGGLLVSGVIVSSLVSRLRLFGNTMNTGRNILEDLGLVMFIAIVGIDAGAGVATQLPGGLVAKIVVAGFFACTLPPMLAWVIGLHVLKLNPAILAGAVAGARSHSAPARAAVRETGSNMPWIGFPVAYAVSGVLLTVFGYVAMTLAG
jgi:putative transport protein